jgi:DNA-binding transcriptional MerR regulator
MFDSPDDPRSSLNPATLADSPVLHGERVAFTGTLASMTHREAFERVEKCGGEATSHVSRQTTMLVVGEEGWPLEADGTPSQKLLQALELQEAGLPCRIVREPEWLHLVGLDERRREVQGEYTPAMLSRLLNVPVNRIRRWERAGLLRASRRVGRMPLFDYQEVTGARRIAELLASGIREDRLQTTLYTLRSVLPDGGESVSELPLVEQNLELLYRDDRGLLEPRTRQRCFDFAPPSDEADADDPDATNETLAFPAPGEPDAMTSEDWFNQGCRLLEANDPQAAVEAFRTVLMEQPGEPDANFHLAEALYRLGNLSAAKERFYAAVELEHDFLEAWIQLGCLHAELEEIQSALDAFDVALRIHPDNADAHWHKADLLWGLGRAAESVPHWDACLRQDPHGPWADVARQRLAVVSK